MAANKINLQTKHEALQELEKGRSKKDVTNQFDIPGSALSNLKKHKQKCFEAFQSSSVKQQGVQVETYEKVNQALSIWFTSMRGNNIPINDQILLEKAREFACSFNCKDFQTSNGWLQGWKDRNVAHLLEHMWVLVLQSKNFKLFK